MAGVMESGYSEILTVKQYKLIEIYNNEEEMRMDKETKELFDALMKEFDRVEQKIYGRLNEMDNKLDTIQKDVNLLKARNDYLDLYALYNQREKRIFDLEQRVS